jgi:hypothetical protein
LKAAINLLYRTLSDGRILPEFGRAVKGVKVQAVGLRGGVSLKFPILYKRPGAHVRTQFSYRRESVAVLRVVLQARLILPQRLRRSALREIKRA